MCCLGSTYGCYFVLYLLFFLTRNKTKFAHIIVAPIHVCQSYLAHSSPILHPVYSLRCFVADSLFFSLTIYALLWVNLFWLKPCLCKNCLFACLRWGGAEVQHSPRNMRLCQAVTCGQPIKKYLLLYYKIIYYPYYLTKGHRILTLLGQS